MRYSHQRDALRALALALAGGVAPLACNAGFGSSGDGGATPTIPGDEATHRALLESIAYNAVAPSFQDAASAAATLADATESYAAAVSLDAGVDQARASAQLAWIEAIGAWQVVEQMQLGPAGSSSTAVGGEDKRDEIYSWPSVNPCRIDQEIIEQDYLNADFFSAHLVNTYGFDALEYLLFYVGDANACAPQLPLNTEGTWAALSADELTSRRAGYAASIASALATETGALAQRWSIENGEFTGYLAQPEQPGAPFGSISGALNEVVRSMFYLDLAVKDAKLAVPAGLLECAAPPCVSELEFVFSRQSKEAVLANLEGFQRLFHGGPDAVQHTGFDDLLVSIGEDQLAGQMTASIELARSTCGAIEGSFTEGLTAEPTALHTCHETVREITNWLKGDFATLLMLTIPNEAAGDAD